jgi:hypothetical protein
MLKRSRRSKDPWESYYTDKSVKDARSCDLLGGVWDKKGLNRNTFKTRGVCFTSKAACKCSKYESKDVMQYQAGTSRFRPLSTEVVTKRRLCNNSIDNCVFNDKNGQCYSTRVIQKKYNNAARVIQKRYKSTLEHREKERVALLLQKRIRQRQADRKREAAAKVIQAKYQAILTKKKRNKAARTIQTFVRKDQRRGYRLPSDWPSDLRYPGIKNYMRLFYAGKKNELPYQSDRKLFDDTNLSKESVSRCGETSLVLSPTQSILFSMARGYATNVTKQPRGVMCWHSTGSGKTCSAASIMEAFWNTNKPIVFCTSIEAKAANPPSAFARCMKTFFKHSVSESEFNKRVHFFSFAQMAHYLQLHKGSGGSVEERKKRSALLSQGAVVIIDEVHNLMNPIPGQQKEHKALEKYLVQKRTGYNLFVLTATPLKGMFDDLVVQYLDANGDFSRFPTVKSTTHPATPAPKAMPDPRKFVGNKTDITMNLIQKHPKDKHYIYSDYYRKTGGKQSATKVKPTFGVMNIQKALDSAGYKQLMPGDKPNRKGRRYCILTTTQMNNAKKDVRQLLDVFNAESNKHGEYCQLMLASQKFNEGLDLKSIRHIHMFESQTFDKQQQTVGRARRFCSHAQLPKSQWDVTVHKYVTNPRTNVSVTRSNTTTHDPPKNEPSHYKSMRDDAVDCMVFKTYHSKLGHRITCN